MHYPISHHPRILKLSWLFVALLVTASCQTSNPTFKEVPTSTGSGVAQPVPDGEGLIFDGIKILNPPDSADLLVVTILQDRRGTMYGSDKNPQWHFTPGSAASLEFELREGDIVRTVRANSSTAETMRNVGHQEGDPANMLRVMVAQSPISETVTFPASNALNQVIVNP